MKEVGLEQEIKNKMETIAMNSFIQSSSLTPNPNPYQPDSNTNMVEKTA